MYLLSKSCVHKELSSRFRTPSTHAARVAPARRPRPASIIPLARRVRFVAFCVVSAPCLELCPSLHFFRSALFCPIPTAFFVSPCFPLLFWPLASCSPRFFDPRRPPPAGRCTLPPRMLPCLPFWLPVARYEQRQARAHGASTVPVDACAACKEQPPRHGWRLAVAVDARRRRWRWRFIDRSWCRDTAVDAVTTTVERGRGRHGGRRVRRQGRRRRARRGPGRRLPSDCCGHGGAGGRGARCWRRSRNVRQLVGLPICLCVQDCPLLGRAARRSV